MMRVLYSLKERRQCEHGHEIISLDLLYHMQSLRDTNSRHFVVGLTQRKRFLFNAYIIN